MPRPTMTFAPFQLGTVSAVFENGDPAVIMMTGEHDVSNVADLSRTLALAAARGRASVIVDMSGVDFMSAATVGALVGAQRLLASQSRSLVVRSPSRQATRVLGICGLTWLIDPASAAVASPSDSALGSWVSVPRAMRRSNMP